MKTRTPLAQVSVTLRPVRPSFPYLLHTGCELHQLLARYGHDALQPRYLTFPGPGGEEEILLVPRLRYEMGEEAWEALGVDFRGKVLKLFYEKL